MGTEPEEEGRSAGWGSTGVRVKVIAFVLILVGSCSLFFPAVTSRPPSESTICKMNLRQIGLAVWNYREEYGAFPPVSVSDVDGKRMHSWRVLILPFLDQQGLYDEYRFDEAWNGKNNRELLKTVPSLYQCRPAWNTPRGDDERTSYVMLETKTPLVEESRKSSSRDKGEVVLKGGPIIVHLGLTQIPWMEPGDWALGNESVPSVAPHSQGFTVLQCATGEVTFMGREELMGLLE